MNKNSLVAVAADRGESSWFRRFFYPPGSKELKISIQAVNGWVSLDPDPNCGFVVKSVARPVNQSGRWLRGPMDEGACLRDVKIARALLGHRWWMVSTWRVHVYRFLGFAALTTLAVILEAMSIPLGALFGLIMMSIPSPCTPRGGMMWCESMGFSENKLAVDKGLDDDGLDHLRDAMRQEAAE